MLLDRFRFSFLFKYWPGLLILGTMLITAGCNFPGSPQTSQPSATAPGAVSQATSLPTAITALPTQTPQPLPPALVESDPPPGSEIPLAKPIKIYFNQDMDRASVEAALSGQPQLSGKFQWQDDSQLVFVPDSPFLPDTQISLTIGTEARSKRGLALLNPQTLRFRTAGYLRLTQVLPASAASDVDPSSAVVATFNRPVVALGDSSVNLKPAFSIQSDGGASPEGRGEWLNTSTYIFYPQPSLAGGMTYTVKIDPALVSVEGSPLQTELGPDDPLLTWSFTTAMPRMVSIDPADGTGPVPLDQKITITFNQVMDQASVQANFALLDSSSQPVQGELSWSEDGKTATFKPAVLLQRGARYTISLSGATQNLGGTPLGVDYRSEMDVVGDPQVSLYNMLGEQLWPSYMPIGLLFTSPLPDQDYTKFITIEPALTGMQTYLDQNGLTLNITSQVLQPMTTYTVTVSADIKDKWGAALGRPYIFTLTTAPLDPNLFFTVVTDPLFLTPQDTYLTAQAANLGNVPVTVGSVSLDDFTLLSKASEYGLRQTYQPADSQTWNQALNVPGNRSQEVKIGLNPQGTSLNPGLYYMRIYTGVRFNENLVALIAVSNIQITFKLSNTDALVWAVDLRTGKPVPMAPVTIYNEDGSLAAQGKTGEDGAFHGTVQPAQDPYSLRYAVVGEPGQDAFGIAYSYWSSGINPWDFGYSRNYNTDVQKVYLYTDRPVYRPGQTVHFRLVIRQQHNTRYTLPSEGSYTATIYNEIGQAVDKLTLPLSAFGTASGDYTLPPESHPGYYRIGDDRNSVNFQVANYRKPEINLQVAYNNDLVVAGQDLSATVNARYFFDAPAGNLPVHWTLTSALSPVELPGYQVGPQDINWMSPEIMNPFMGRFVSQGDARTGPDGLLNLTLPTEASNGLRYTYTLEATIQDESNIPVSARAEIEVNPSQLNIGVKPDVWTAQAGQSLSFEVLAADLKLATAGAHTFKAEFRRVEWVRQNPDNAAFIGMPTYTPKYTPVGSTDFMTGDDGLARLQFTADTPGTYQLDVTGEGAESQVMVWVGGPGQVVWPNEPNNKLSLTADRDEYQPGDTAQIFIPNPLGESALSLVTVERDIVMRYQVLDVQGNGITLNLPIQDDDAPNIYVSVTLLGKTADGKPDFRQGYTQLKVSPAKQILNVSLISQPDRAGPGEPVTFEIRVTDQDGKPVQGEFSLAVVDLAALALSNPLSQDIVPAFYSEQALGVTTGVSLAAYGARTVYTQPGGGGGGGEGDQFLVARENFPDTAYWNPSIMTDGNGEAQVSLDLPDNLTTWQIDLRGLTGDTRVGQAQIQLVTTKDLLVRPETPRFLVAGDHAALAAIVQNNTGQALQAEVTLQSPGFALDDLNTATRQVSISAGGRIRVEWWGTVQDVEQVEAVFTARSGNLQDAARPDLGPLLVYHYTAPLTFATAGTLEQPGERLELVSLPRTFQVQGGQLQIDLSPSLAAALLDSLNAMESNRYDVTEEVLSRFLANLEAYQALQKFGIQSPDLQDRLSQSMKESLSRLGARQNNDGGWGWWSGEQSDAYLTAYVIFGLGQARLNGITVDDGIVQRGADYLTTQFPPVQSTTPNWQLDRLVFLDFALSGVGRPDPGNVDAAYQLRDQLSSWAQALLALTIVTQQPEDARITTLVSDLQAGAVRSATGVHWEDRDPVGHNLVSPATATAMVVYTLAQREPASTVLPDAVRYLMSARGGSGSWASSYETAWAILALTEVMQGTGEVGGEYRFGASLNGTPVASGQASAGAAGMIPVSAVVPIENLYPEDPNALLISRQEGNGRLYYSAYLQVDRPADNTPAYNGGLSIAREYFLADLDCKKNPCQPVTSAGAGQLITVRLTIVAPNGMNHLMVEDRIPAGAEILDKTLKTSQQSIPDQAGVPQQEQPDYDPTNPFADGWAWWLFSSPQIYDNRVVWTADSLPAGTYQLTYTITTVHPGQYQVIPARAWELYFPEVQGASAGSVFEINAKP